MNGRLRLEGLPAGKYQVMVRHDDPATGWSWGGGGEVELSTGDATEAVIDVRARR